jgi:hypothetical protein
MAHEEKAQWLLIKEVVEYDNITSLQVAVSAEDYQLVGHACCQNLLSNLWYNKLMPENEKYKVKNAFTNLS